MTALSSILLVLAGACAGGSAMPAPASPDPVIPQLAAPVQADEPAAEPQADVLQELQAELARQLGAAASAIPYHAPDTRNNQWLVTTSQPGYSGPDTTFINVRWREQLAGDYDCNGQVDELDLHTIARHLNQWADTPEVPDYVDGNRDGYITMHDVITIARNYRQAVDSYRVWRRELGQESWVLLRSTEAPPEAGAGYSFKRTDWQHRTPDNYDSDTRAPLRPERLFIDQVPTRTYFEYRVEPYWSYADQAGLSSPPALQQTHYYSDAGVVWPVWAAIDGVKDGFVHFTTDIRVPAELVSYGKPARLSYDLDADGVFELVQEATQVYRPSSLQLPFEDSQRYRVLRVSLQLADGRVWHTQRNFSVR